MGETVGRKDDVQDDKNVERESARRATEGMLRLWTLVPPGSRKAYIDVFRVCGVIDEEEGEEMLRNWPKPEV